jgi:RNA 2',3'-cyclic 3'-phosphodiesterase
MSDQTAFDFIAALPWRPKKPERTFVCIVPDAAAAKAIARTALSIAAEAHLADQLVKPERYHLSLAHISDRDRIRSKDEFAVGRAARMIEFAAFEVCFSRAGSVRGPPRRGRPPNHPLVLLADDGAIRDLFRSLGSELRKFRIAVGEYFTPHITLTYSEQFVPMRAIEPIRFTVREFVLLHSERGLTKYNVLGTWQLD